MSASLPDSSADSDSCKIKENKELKFCREMTLQEQNTKVNKKKVNRKENLVQLTEAITFTKDSKYNA